MAQLQFLTKESSIKLLSILQVVSTKVGGVPSVLPPDLVWLTEPSVAGLVAGLNQAIYDRKVGKVVPPWVAHQKSKEAYQWKDIASCTKVVYNKIIQDPVHSLDTKLSWYHKLVQLENFFLLYFLQQNIYCFCYLSGLNQKRILTKLQMLERSSCLIDQYTVRDDLSSRY
ncbi:phosphatidylinositol N-acetylglucosaminyltransferase subunit A-like isoform X1 [Tachypleus tridentatus]|uniref:phosphatidylinositol N-acetylglucosaminyltransferase subunit A-like isoform X1 n=1 Tax=Tachypleus tridentatus TaxID=6853 RepID=UPI003FD5022B